MSTLNNNPEIDTSTASRKKDKICKVCGDSSIGYNFGAISCESCKAFFRRNARKFKVIQIKFILQGVSKNTP